MAGRADFPYSPVPDGVKRVMEKIPSVGVPEKADAKWLAALGFGGGNNAMTVPLFKQLGILDTSSAPTDFYRAIRAKDRSSVGAGIKAAYPALFAMYPDANRQDDEALMQFARTHTDYGEETQKRAVRTFKAIVGFGDYDGGSSGGGDDGRENRQERGGGGGRGSSGGNQPPVGLTVNIQLQLPPSADGEIYDKLFAAMAKHLKGLVASE